MGFWKVLLKVLLHAYERMRFGTLKKTREGDIVCACSLSTLNWKKIAL